MSLLEPDKNLFLNILQQKLIDPTSLHKTFNQMG